MSLYIVLFYKKTDKICGARFIDESNKDLFLLALVTFSCIGWMPNYFLSNDGLGTFWTYPVAMANILVPFVLWFVNKKWMFFTLISTFFTIVFMKSKAALLYPLLPLFFYYFHYRYLIKSPLSLIIPVFFLVGGFAVLSLGFVLCSQNFFIEITRSRFCGASFYGSKCFFW